MSSKSYVLDLDFVKYCMGYLRTRRVHRQFIGYLCICNLAVLNGRQDNLKPKFRPFFVRFLSAEPELPYLVPFNEAGSLDANVWLNKNIAGSYAPSSMRSTAPLRRVVDTYGGGRDATYALREAHAELCLEHLLFDEPIDALALAGFLFRDHSFTFDEDVSMTPQDIVSALYEILGLESPASEKFSIFSPNESPVLSKFSYSLYMAAA